MAAPLLVKLSPAPDDSEKAKLKLQSYFQSGKRSGGGECELQAGPEPGTYLVYFHQEQDKKNVESRTDHVLEMGAKCLKVSIQPEKGGLSGDQSTSQAAASCSQPYHISPLPRGSREKQAAEGQRDTAAETVTKKIFLTVSAILNTSMFTKQQREKIALICPNLKREGNPDVDGYEKLTGDYTDIEKAYHYFKDILAGYDQHHDFSHTGSKNGLEDGNGLKNEESDDFTVPSALYEYFCHTCKDQIKELNECFGVHLRNKDCNNGYTSVCFNSNKSSKSSASMQKAKDFFTSAFQKNIKDVQQEKISLTNGYQLNETIMKLNNRFSNLLAKQEENQLLLRGPKKEISNAKNFLEEEMQNSRTEKNVDIPCELYTYRNEIAVDASVFNLLETALQKEIEDIKENFDTVMEKKHSSDSQEMLIIFKPRSKISDRFSHAIEAFINAFQNAFAMLREKLISCKLSEYQEQRLNMLDGKQLEDLHVKFKKKEDKIILYGLPNHLDAAEKHIMKLLNAGGSAETKTRTPLGNKEATGVSEKKYGDRQKSSFCSKEEAKAKTEEDTDSTCPICMEGMNDKVILTKCKHAFCRVCITKAMTYKKTCPVCNTVYGPMQGNQPEGEMSFQFTPACLPGYPNCGTIVIHYDMKGGIQTKDHPNPGAPYKAVFRTAYLPNNKEGQEILQLLKRAFQQKLIFTVGQSRTTGLQGVITWNDIHHKTSIYGGPTNFGYPDPDYLKRVRSELKARGIE
ncbi:E3 ubiquitin-protein ligase DTX3L [Anas platyrhynchos]|uniref:E3 ubiquitin-protein ligase DTX3L n=1 Tax=Anas platyrhynchos TaxID=8839 RepID=UPI003AF21919